MDDTRNLRDEYKGKTNEQVFDALSKNRSGLEVAIENVSHDFNAGTIVRNANSFNVAKVHVIGRRKYNRRGAMCTDKYLEICYWANIAEFVADQRERGREIVAIENNVPEVKPLHEKKFKRKTTLVFGGESDGLSKELLKEADDVREIESFGSTRSVNVGVASGIAMYAWARQWLLRDFSGEGDDVE
ncbi:TrmH family RNA methyltransferase [Candidatus Saccharibacteria bacterium]|nr:TrmH family RNA methyltransferase [Candidatus Saccharibacteria bacterium]